LTVAEGSSGHLFSAVDLVLYVDGASKGNPGPAAAGIIIKSSDGVVLMARGRFLGKQTNNQAEYAALIDALEAAAMLKPSRVRVVSDSQLLVMQMLGQYKVRNDGLKPLAERARRLASGFAACDFVHVPRCQNKEADRMAGLAAKAGEDVEE